MRLERLEINGFKSFSDRSELAFDKGVTAIVGPNGCGKSNVADAITWVMGEQSAKSLRGDRMEDVLFSGSDVRKPTAAAEVRLRLSGFLKNLTAPAFEDATLVEGAESVQLGANVPASGNGHGPGNGHGHGNGNGHANGSGHSNGNGHADRSGHHGYGNGNGGGSQAESFQEIIQSVAREVEVTRRLYRSGESEYLIDGQTCRLRDIHDLLMDTGLGAKAYAIIEQGKIGMILSSRPTDRRQLIEEAAGVTKYKARRRAAALKLEAAHLNLTRIDDIVFEVEKQRGTLKRQASKARRYQKLRDELRRWEKVLFARKYRQLAETIESARAALGAAREREAMAAARVAEREADLARLRIEFAESESRAVSTREAAHSRELDINRLQQQIAFDTEQIDLMGQRSAAVEAELEALNARRAPASALLESRREAARVAYADRDAAAAALAVEAEAYGEAHGGIEGLEADVEAARSEVFSAINAATALRHALEHGATTRERVGESLAKLQVETEDARIESERLSAARETAVAGLRRAQVAIDATRVARAARESELASARIEHEWRARSVRTREHELAGLVARLRSLQELEAARAGYGDGARAVLAHGDGDIHQQGAVADYLEVDPGYERAVEACLGDLLQHVVVDRLEHAAAGLSLVRAQGAGRCGFLIASAAPVVGDEPSAAPPAPAPGLVAMSSVVRAHGPFAAAITRTIGAAWIAPTYDAAAGGATETSYPVTTMNGDVFHGPHLLVGGGRDEARGILETKREIRDLEVRVAGERDALCRLAEETAGFEATIAEASNAIAALSAEHHRQEKVVVALEAQLQRADDESSRVAHKVDQIARERQQAEMERDALDRRQAEARTAIADLESAQRLAEDRLTVAQRRIFEARESAEDLGRRAADAGAAHAALVERAAAIALEVTRLEEGAADLEVRAAALIVELDETRGRVDALRAAVIDERSRLDVDVLALVALQQDLHAADESTSTLRIRAEEHEAAIKNARADFEEIRTTVAELDIARATAESDLAHLASVCVDTVQATLDDVMREVSDLDPEGRLEPTVAVLDDDPDDAGVEAGGEDLGAPATAALEALDQVGRATEHVVGAEEAIATLRVRIDRLGPVNMMAIEQFDELETRHTFLTTQRKDLVESIAQTSEAIKRIDETTKRRFSEAFSAINQNFQEMFSTLFGGGRAGLALIDENDPLESGIEIIAQPPGKRLQSVQLLSGGEKALTAISLMFGLFKYKPSPFCLLDEIDAPLDDANIGRFVEMLRSMQEHTQFILITHNRKTMEIADRLYGVTMEEPGVSKLISVQLN